MGWAKPTALLGTLAVAYAVCAVGTPGPQHVVNTADTGRRCDAGFTIFKTYTVQDQDQAIQFTVRGAQGNGNGSDADSGVSDQRTNSGGYGAVVTATFKLPSRTVVNFVRANSQSGCHQGGGGGSAFYNAGASGGGSSAVLLGTGEILIEAGGGGGAGGRSAGQYGGQGGNAGLTGSNGGTGKGNSSNGGTGGNQTGGDGTGGDNVPNINSEGAGGGGGGGYRGGTGGQTGATATSLGGGGGGGASSWVNPNYAVAPAFSTGTGTTGDVAFVRTAMSVNLTASAVGATPRAGDRITYTATAQNTGTGPATAGFTTPSGWTLGTCLTGVGTPTGSASNVATTLSPPSDAGDDGQILQCTYTRPITQAEIDSSATVTGQITSQVTSPAPDSLTTPVNSPQVSTKLNGVPDITLDSATPSAEPSGGYVAGSVITFALTAKDTGNTTLTGVTNTIKLPIANPVAGGPTDVTLSCSTANILPDKSATCTTAGYTVTADDVKKGTIAAKATAGSAQKTSAAVDVPITLTQDNKFVATLTHTGPAQAQKDGTIAFTAKLANTGTSVLKNVSISVPLPGCVNVQATLDPGKSIQCDATYTITQADMNAGGVSFTATGQATGPSGTQLPQQSPTDTVTLAATPAITTDLVAALTTPGTRKPAKGDIVHYSATVTNTGNVTLSQLTTKDTQTPAPVAPVAFTCELKALEPAASTTCTADYTITTDDISAGQIVNSVVVSGKPPVGNAVSDPGDATVALAQLAKLTAAIKITDPGDLNFDSTVNTGDQPKLTVTITNSGNVPITGIVPVVKANDTTLDCSIPPDPLDPTGVLTCDTSYTVKKADVTAGTIRYDVTAGGTDPNGTTVDAAASLSSTTGADPVTSTTSTPPPTDDTSVTTSPPTSATSDQTSTTASAAGAVVTTTGSAAAVAAAAKPSGSLPTTGSDVGGLVAICAMLALVGGGLLLLVRPARRRRRG